MSTVDFVSEHGRASLHGSEGHYLSSLPARLTIGLLDPTGFKARERYADILAPNANLHMATDIGYGTLFTSAWGTDLYGDFAWRGHRLDTHQISLNTALAVGGNPLRFACRFGAAGFPWVDGPHRAWLADIIDEGVSTGLFRGPNQGWDQVASLLRERDDEPVVITFSGRSPGFPNPYLGGWMPPELGDDYTKLTDEQKCLWDERQDEWYESDDEPMKWRIATAALRANRKESVEMRPDTWRDLYFGNGLTAFDLTAHDRAERLDRAFGLVAAR